MLLLYTSDFQLNLKFPLFRCASVTPNLPLYDFSPPTDIAPKNSTTTLGEFFVLKKYTLVCLP